MIFEDKRGKRYFPHEVIFCDVDMPEFTGYVTLDSFRGTRCVDRWDMAYLIPGTYVEYEKGGIVKGVKYHKQQ